ncbi:tetratricopeptide repeat protein [Aeoliella mucimassa]|uniref:Tetratricopeptide repeat protein n=1 Tax=Aeoliella mucimassa TaxID=2527972 RepID=A0A518ASF6_9BACT|nr:tetratricopeptide repeat protein [Aeoliella mucimassa]QDU57664.1 tetratricopeptide repeat protein [Aeoliella mucimassa]
MAKTQFLHLSRILATIAASLLLMSTVAQAQDGLQDAVDSAISEGYDALEQENYEGARDAFTEAIAASNIDPRPYIGRARAFAALELPQDAMKDFKQAMDFTNGSSEQLKALRAETQYYRGLMYMDLGNQFIGTALPDLQAAYEADRSNLEYSFALGKAYALSAQFAPGAAQQAEPLLTEYLEANPDDAEALRLRGTAYAGMSKIEEATADLEKAISLDPDDHLSYVTLATIYIADEDFGPAIDNLETAIEKYVPEEGMEDIPFAQAYLTLALVYEEKGKAETDTAEAEKAYLGSIETCDTLLGLLPETENFDATRAATYFRQGVNHRLLKEYGKAIKAFTDAIDLNPEMGEAYFRRAICFAKMGENNLALRDLTDTETLNYGDARAYLWEGMVYAQMGEYREAIRSYNKAISYSNRYLDAYLNRAHAYFQLGDYVSAIESFNECIRLQPSGAVYYFKRGLCQQNLGENANAIQSYTNAIQVDEQYVDAYDLLIPALEQQGQAELANRYREKRASITQ